MLERQVFLIMDLMIWKSFTLQFCCVVCIFLGICAIYHIEMWLVFRKSVSPFGQVKTKMYLPKSPFFKYSFAGASRQVTISVPVILWWARNPELGKYPLLFTNSSKGSFSSRSSTGRPQQGQPATGDPVKIGTCSLDHSGQHGIINTRPKWIPFKWGWVYCDHYIV